MFEQFAILREFFNKSGPVLSGIFLLSSFLWCLILERYYFLYRGYPKCLQRIITQWRSRSDKTSWYALKIRDGLLADIALALHQNLIPIKVLTSVLPLLGLLGTVLGMITIFEVLNTFGTGNVRGIADGISKALLPTTAGLVTAIIGLYFSVDLDRRTRLKTLATKELLGSR